MRLLLSTVTTLSLAAVAAGDPDAAAAVIQRMLTLTALYMQLATSDQVLVMMAREAPIDGIVSTFPITSTGDARGDPPHP